MPNTFAYITIAMWPFVALYFYKRFNSLDASFIVIVGGYMLLPVNTFFDLPMIPAIGKDEISGLSALLGLAVFKKIRFYPFGVTREQKILFIALLVIPVINALFNTEVMFNGVSWIRGLTLYDAISQVLMQYLELIPFLIGLVVIKNVNDMNRFLSLLCLAGLAYSPLILLEIRLSPQLHTWIYGFFPHSFAQQLRYDGFRAVVFIGHGLLVSTFYFVCCSASFLKYRLAPQQNKLKWFLVFVYLLLILILNKSVGPVLLTLIAVAIMYTPTNLVKSRIIFSLAVLFFVYPFLSIIELVPYDWIIDKIYQIDPDRAQSMETRFINESVLIQHANEKLLIGWGSWSRNRFYNSISDGFWLIVFGTYGVLYFFALFLLFVLPIFTQGNLNKKHKPLFWGAASIIALLLLNQLPNSSMEHSYSWFLAGALAALVSTNRSLS